MGETSDNVCNYLSKWASKIMSIKQKQTNVIISNSETFAQQITNTKRQPIEGKSFYTFHLTKDLSRNKKNRKTD